MLERQSNPPTKVTLEDLLRLKRAERPPPEFWTQFERDLRQKQLAALVVRKSWWLELSSVYSRFGRMRVPVGAAAVLALSLFTVRYYGGLGAPAAMPGDTGTIDHSQTLAAAQHPETSRPARLAVVTSRAPASELAAAQEVNAAASTAVARREAPAEGSSVIPWLGEVVDDRPASSDFQASARFLAAHLAAVASLDPDLDGTTSRPLGFEDRGMPSAGPRRTAEVLPTAAAVADSRHARLLAALGAAGVYNPEPAAPEHARRSVLRYLAEDGWDRSMGRLEAEGDKLSIKF